MTPCVLLVASAAAIAACGTGSESASSSTVGVTSTAYVTIPARTTTTAAPPLEAAGASVGGGGATTTESSAAEDPAQERVHEIESGDNLVRIAREYDVPVDYLPAYNAWSDGLGHALVPGETMRIPPNDWTPDAATESLGTEPEDGSACETYKIRAGDTPAGVAADHGVTVDELAAANTATQYYEGFVVGIVINIPC